MVFLLFFLLVAGLEAAEPLDFPVAVWYGEPTDQSRQDLQVLKDGGFNLCLLTEKDSGRNLLLLREAEQIGINCILSEAALDRFISGSDLSFRRIDSLTQLYSRFRAFRGFLLFNQPTLNDLPSFAELADFFNGKYPRLECMTIARGLRFRDEAERRSYDNYLADLLRKLKIEHLVADNPGILAGQLREEYFANLAALRRAAQQYERPFWAFVLLEPIGRPPMTPIAYIRMQVYSGLAFGAQGVIYYAFRSSPSSSRTATLVDSDGRLSNSFSYCVVVNQEIGRWAKLLMHCKSIAVYGSSPMPDVEPLPPLQLIKKIDAPGMLLGFFRSPENETLLMLVNTNYRYGVRCRVFFADHCPGMEEIAKDFVEPYRIRFRSDDQERFAELIFKAGEGRLFRLFAR
ncbi:MAG: hypothetical protein ONB12_07140 [candidate division KSB1 bacterium]|nr:hypothetical protein [candidate division KSB1 bacterium]